MIFFSRWISLNGPPCRHLLGKNRYYHFLPANENLFNFFVWTVTFQRFFFVLTAKDLIRMTATANKYFFMTYAAHTTMTIKWLSANDSMIRHSLLFFSSFLSHEFSSSGLISANACCLCAIIASGLQLVFDNNDAAAPSFYYYPNNYLLM